MVSPKLSPGADNASEGFIWMIYMFVMTYCLSGFKHEDKIILDGTRLFRSGNLKIVERMTKSLMHYFANS